MVNRNHETVVDLRGEVRGLSRRMDKRFDAMDETLAQLRSDVAALVAATRNEEPA